MKRGAPWRGFDYTEGREVTRGRDEWRVLIEQAHRQDRIGGDLALFDAKGEITHEVYDKER